jgi:hypothetical protein
VRRSVALFAAAFVLMLVAAAPAMAAFGLKDLGVTFANEDGTPATQAGSHPFALVTKLAVNSTLDGKGNEVPEGELKDLTIGQVEGLVGDPDAVPQCSQADFNNRVEGRASCPDSSAVGVAAVKAEFEAVFKPGEEFQVHAPIYNLVPSPGEPAKLGFVVLNVPVTIDLHVAARPPYNVVAELTNVPQSLVFYGSEVILWGNPANQAHDTLRGKCVADPTTPTEEPISLGSCPAEVAEAPFLTLPRACQGPLATSFTSDSWLQPNLVVDAPPVISAEMTVCEDLKFAAEIKAKPTTESAQSPSGIDFDLEVDDPGLVSSTEEAQSDIEKVEATFPVGVTVNPSAADGLGACSKAQFDAATVGNAGCPEAAKIGNVEIETPLLEEPLAGAVFVAQPDDPATTTPGAENPFDSLLALYLVVRSPLYGIVVTQAGKVELDPKTGRLVSTFEGIPQLPFSHLHLHFREGPRAPLVTPAACGTYDTEAVLTPRSGGEPIAAKSSFVVSSGIGAGACRSGVPPFGPGFEAGSLNNNAGAFSPFYMRLTRGDGEQAITRFSSVLPAGVTGKIAGIVKCPDAQIDAAKKKTGLQELASPSCPSGSAVGHVLAGAGVGPALTYVRGEIYLAGPFAGAPLSVVVITPAVAGPFDVGNVVVREALKLDPTTAEVQIDGAASDPIPTILKGIPLELRDLRVYADRQNFTLNPTSCNQESSRATIFGGFADALSPADDISVTRSARYQAANCSALGFKPKLSLRLKGLTRRVGHPAVQAVVQARPGDANIGRAVVTLPPSEQIENAHINNPCTRGAFNEGKCPPKSVLGFARAFTPLLDEPLEGPVYFRANGGERLLPDLVADLHGQFNIVLIGHIDSVNARVRTTFETVPDAPITKFVLNLAGGKKGLLVNNRNLCKKTQRAKALFTGQNGKEFELSPVVATSCKKKPQRRKHR